MSSHVYIGNGLIFDKGKIVPDLVKDHTIKMQLYAYWRAETWG